MLEFYIVLRYNFCMNIFKLEPNLGGDECNTYIVENGDSTVIIDCGAKLEDVKKYITKKVACILLSHGHFDHIYELENYINEFNCPVYGGEGVVEKLADSKCNLSASFSEKLVVFGEDVVKFVKEIREQLLNIGGFDIECITLKGHSECGMGYVIEGNLFCGDTLFCNCVGRYDLYDSSFSALRNSLKKINKLEGIVACFPGHGEDFELNN